MLWVEEPQEDLYCISESGKEEDGLEKEKKYFCILFFNYFFYFLKI